MHKDGEWLTIITKTPFNISFFGGGTDIENYFSENGGAVLSTTFDKCCYVNVYLILINQRNSYGTLKWICQR
jgi:galactokinase/mevalonate kinase-like predicted kinase